MPSVSRRFRALTLPGFASAQLDALREVYVRFVQEMFALTAAMSGPIALARRLGVLGRVSNGARLHVDGGSGRVEILDNGRSKDHPLDASVCENPASSREGLG